MTTRTTYNLLRRGITALALVCISVITFAENPEPTYVAQIDETKYATLQAAIGAATDGQTVTLIADITETATYTINKKITIDFGEHTITASHTTSDATTNADKVFDITASGNLIVTGSTGGVTDETVLGIFNNAGALTINGGHYTTNTDDYGVVYNNGGTCTIAGGELRGAWAAVYNRTGAVIVNGGTLYGAARGINAKTGTTVNITNGSVSSPSIAVYGEASSTITISGGNITAPHSDDSEATQTSVYLEGSNAKAIISGGTINAKWGVQVTEGGVLSLTAGSITATASGVDVRGEGSTATISGGTITATDGIFVTDHATLIVNTEASITGTNTAISGNGSEGKGNTNITINGGTMTTGENVKGVGVYHPQIGGQLTINGGTITGNTAVEVRSGTLDITGGTLTANAASYSCNPNGSGSTTVGAALAIAQHTTKQDITINISGGTFEGVKAISESNPQENDPAPRVTMSVTDGTFNGEIITADVHNFISGGTYSTVDENFGNYLQRGYAVKATSADPATYSVVAQTKTEVSESIPEGDAKTAAEALAANTATATTAGLAYNQSLEISIDNVTVVDGVVKTATFNVTPKDVNGATISSWSGEVTFRLPITNTVAAGKWVNLKHNSTPITGTTVQTDANSNKYVAVTTSSFSPFEYQVLLNDPVAQIGETKYETMADAIAAATAEETTIKLIADVTENIVITAGKNVNFVGGEYKLTGAITNNGTLKISSGVFTVEPDAEWIATDSEVMVGEDNTYVVAAEGTAEAKIVTTVDAESITTLYQTIALAITAAGTEATTITLLKNVSAETITIPTGANITLVLGEVTLTKAITNSSTLNISGGTISGAITNNNALTITSGTISGNITNAESATMTIAAGTFTGTITNNAAKANLTINGGTFTSKPVGNNYTCASDHELIYDGTNYVYDAISKAEAKIGADSYYYTIAQAIEVADATITLLKNPTSTETIEIPEGKDITLQIKDGVTLTKVIANSGTLQITSGTTSGAIKIMTADATVTIANVVVLEEPSAVELDGSLDTYVLKTIANSGSKLYKAELKYSIQVGSGITDATQRSAAEAMAQNDALSTTSGLGENQSIAVTILSVTLDGSKNVTSATFNVVLSGADGQAITTASNDITFRLPVSEDIEPGKWVNISNESAPIPGTTVQAGKYIEITTRNFPTFSYTVLSTEPVAKIGETKYESVAAAIEATTTAQIEILKAITEDITVAAGKTITLAGGEYTLSGTITNRGTLTLTSGTYSGAITSNGGTITINGGSFSSSLTTENSGTIDIMGGTFAGSCNFSGTGIAISGGTFDNIPAVGVCADGYVPVKNGENKFNMTDDWKMTDETAIGSINYYGSEGYTVATATYTRSVGMVGVGGNPDGTKYGTICLPFTITAAPTDGTKLYKATSVTDSKLTITEVTDFSSAIPAGTPLIFELSAVAKTMSIVSTSATIIVADLVAPTDGNLLRGTYTETTFSEGALSNKYYLNGDAFHQAVNSLKVPAYRAYIEYTTPVGGGSAPERLNIVKASDPIVTPLENATAEVSIVAVYDLQGRNIGRLQSGINIVRLSNGQTVKIIKM